MTAVQTIDMMEDIWERANRMIDKLHDRIVGPGAATQRLRAVFMAPGDDDIAEGRVPDELPRVTLGSFFVVWGEQTAPEETGRMGWWLMKETVIPGVWTLPNGDPGYPDVAEVIEVDWCPDTHQAAQALFESFMKETIGEIEEAMQGDDMEAAYPEAEEGLF
jgi:hypothetical protein